MMGLPQSVRDRLAAQQQGASTHPDADMLNAFMEDALTAGERSSVLDHLARCPTCREVVAISGSLPEEVAVAPAPTAPVRKRLWNWGTVRWAAPAVAVVVIGAAVLLRVGTGDVERPAATTVHEEVKQQPPAIEESGTLQDEPQTPVPQSAKKEHALTDGRVQTKAKSDSRDYDAFAQRRESQLAKDQRKNEPATDQIAPMGGALASQSRVFVDKLEPSAKSAETRAESAAAPPPPPARQAQELSSADTIQVESAAPPMTDAVADSKENDRRKSVVAKAAAPSPRRDGTFPAGNSSNSYRLNQTIDVPRVVVAWRVSQGHLMKTYDRIAWDEVVFPESSEITTYSAIGPHVWAGGKKGQLYHSIDSGETWSRVLLGTPASQEDIRGIEFKDINAGTITTATGASWKTTDAGRTWSRS
jgi:hypothetical protein